MGPWEKYGGSSQGAGRIMGPPKEPAPRAAPTAEEIALKRQQLRNAQVGETTARLNNQAAEIRLNQARQGPQLTPQARAQMIAKLNSMDLIDQQLRSVENLYRKNLKGGWSEKGVGVLAEYLPSDANKQFNAAADGILPLTRQALSTSAKDGDSDRELAVWQSLIPRADERDAVNEQRIAQMRAMIETNRRNLRSTLGIREAAPKKDARLPDGWSIKRVR